ncbi:hypothetical protein [Rufibacter tibetensis]|uniref:STAS/SEC14 domain-containing protein n=1 Tax=Rufibacter tibetensis TaxID=512763 RepID=A0A0N7HX47_9BACT|nr:hypothetical protein [Rufibacter tibetensis]ALJ01041.1 hypothetical protein DC20_21160 [Rufibacter tibetensis]
MPKTELKKPNGDVFLIAERAPDNSYIHAQWIGIQTLDTVKQGGSLYIEMLEDQPCSRLLNNHKELIGPWDIAQDWIVQYWTPKVMELGLEYMGQVLASGIYGKMSFHQLHQHIGDKFQIKMFEEVAPALEWLLTVDSEKSHLTPTR